MRRESGASFTQSKECARPRMAAAFRWDRRCSEPPAPMNPASRSRLVVLFAERGIQSYTLFVKTIGIFGVAVTVSIALLQPAQGRPQGSARSFSSGHHYSASAGHYSGRSRGYSGGNARYYRTSPRYSSQAAFRNGAYYSVGPRPAVNRTTALNPRAYTSNPQLAASSQCRPSLSGFRWSGACPRRNPSRNWDRSRDHVWHGHRCHWYNNSWVILDPWFLYPWAYYGYGYYPYGAYSYYDDGYYGGGYYDDAYVPQEYSQSEYDNGAWNSNVRQVQAALARKGYYRGAIDGSFGPATRSALRQYQLNHGLEVTGRIDRSVVAALERR